MAHGGILPRVANIVLDLLAKCHHYRGMDHADVIRILGGKARLALALGLNRNVVTKWHVRGIPSNHWHRVVELASYAGLNVTAEDLRRSKPVSSSKSSHMGQQNANGTSASIK